MRFCHRRKKTRHLNGVFYRFFVRGERDVGVFLRFRSHGISFLSCVSRSWSVFFSLSQSQLYLSFPHLFSYPSLFSSCSHLFSCFLVDTSKAERSQSKK